MKILITAALFVALLAAPAAAATPDLRVQIDCDGYALEMWTPVDSFKVRADGVVLWDAPVDPYWGGTNSWAKAKRVHRVVVTVDGERFVYRVKGCR